MNMMFLACSMSKDGSEGAIFDMWHWRVGGDIHRKLQQIASWKSDEKHQNSAAIGTALLSTYHTLSALVSQ